MVRAVGSRLGRAVGIRRSTRGGVCSGAGALPFIEGVVETLVAFWLLPAFIHWRFGAGAESAAAAECLGPVS